MAAANRRRPAVSARTLDPLCRNTRLHELLSMGAGTATGLNPKISNAVLSAPTHACAKRCHRIGARKKRKKFSVAAVLQYTDADDE
jgi:hypothetical protein